MINAVVAMLAVAVAATALGVFVPKRWSRTIAALVLAGIALFTVVFSMGDLRAHGQAAQSAGQTREFIAGMAERDQRMLPRRAAIFVSVCGLAVVCLVAVRRSR